MEIHIQVEAEVGVEKKAVEKKSFCCIQKKQKAKKKYCWKYDKKCIDIVKNYKYLSIT